eukprot:GEMP01026720.1.p1 GENE.GEMP01026720.1~~GEMP01026720.1.p1  ORF type:complete len:506 (+),score=127.52 GEMP01026720.1:316-1833(+)
MRLVAWGFVCVTTGVSFEGHTEGVSRWLASIVQTNGDVTTTPIDSDAKDGQQLESRTQEPSYHPVLRVEKPPAPQSLKQLVEPRVKGPSTESAPSSDTTSDAATVSNNTSLPSGDTIGIMERDTGVAPSVDNSDADDKVLHSDRDTGAPPGEKSSDAGGRVLRAPVIQAVNNEINTSPIVGDRQQTVATGESSPSTVPQIVKRIETVVKKKIRAPVVGADGSVVVPASNDEEIKKTETTIGVPHPTMENSRPTSTVVLGTYVTKHLPFDAGPGTTQEHNAAVPKTPILHSAKVEREVLPVNDFDARMEAGMDAAAHAAAVSGRSVVLGGDQGGANRMDRAKFKNADSEYWRKFGGRAQEYSKQYTTTSKDSSLSRGMVAVADGTGLGGNPYRRTLMDYLMEEQLRFHIRVQDLCLLLMLLLVYACAVAYGFVYVYRASRFLTRAKYFDDHFVLHCRNSDPNEFLECFNRRSAKVQLHIIGYRTDSAGGFMHTMWRGQRSRTPLAT